MWISVGEDRGRRRQGRTSLAAGAGEEYEGGPEREGTFHGERPARAAGRLRGGGGGGCGCFGLGFCGAGGELGEWIEI